MRSLELRILGSFKNKVVWSDLIVYHLLLFTH